MPISSIYLFDLSGRAEAQKQLYDDIPRLVTEYGDAVGVADFYGRESHKTMLRPPIWMTHSLCNYR